MQGVVRLPWFLTTNETIKSCVYLCVCVHVSTGKKKKEDFLTSDDSSLPPSVELLSDSSSLQGIRGSSVLVGMGKLRFTHQKFSLPVAFIANDLRQWLCTKLNFYLPP